MSLALFHLDTEKMHPEILNLAICQRYCGNLWSTLRCMQVHPGVPSLLGCDMELPRKLYPEKMARKTLQTSPEIARRATVAV